jgi:histone H3
MPINKSLITPTNSIGVRTINEEQTTNTSNVSNVSRGKGPTDYAARAIGGKKQALMGRSEGRARKQCAPRKNPAPTGGIKKKSGAPPKNQPKHTKAGFGRGALAEIRFEQNRVHRSIPLQSFRKLVVELVHDIQTQPQPGQTLLRIQKEAMEALLEAGESYLTVWFEGLNLCAIHSQRITVMSKDCKTLSAIRNRFNCELESIFDEHGERKW